MQQSSAFLNAPYIYRGTPILEGEYNVEIFFAADGVHLLNCKNEGEIVGQGYGEGYDLEAIKSYFSLTTLALNKP